MQGTIHDVLTGDVLLHRRGWSLVSWIIAAIGRSPYSHAGMADWVGKKPVQLETREWHGARVMLLEREVARKPGRIDVYRPLGLATDERRRAANRMWRMVGKRYGWLALARVMLLRVPLLRLLLPVRWKVERDGLTPYCSMAVSRAYRSVGVDLVPSLADRFTEPGDLARSGLLVYRFTLEPEQ